MPPISASSWDSSYRTWISNSNSRTVSTPSPFQLCHAKIIAQDRHIDDPLLNELSDTNEVLWPTNP